MKRYLLLFAVMALFTLTGCKWLVQEAPTAEPVQNGESSEEIATFWEPPASIG